MEAAPAIGNGNVGCFSCRNRDAVQGTKEQLLWFCTEKRYSKNN